MDKREVEKPYLYRGEGEGLQKRQNGFFLLCFEREWGGALLNTELALSVSLAARRPRGHASCQRVPLPPLARPRPPAPRAAAGLFPALAGPHPVPSGPASCLCCRFVASWWSARARPSAEPPPRDWLSSQPSLVLADLSLAPRKPPVFTGPGLVQEALPPGAPSPG